VRLSLDFRGNFYFGFLLLVAAKRHVADIMVPIGRGVKSHLLRKISEVRRLSEVYSMKKHRVLYFIADDGVPFQAVADAIDIAENAPVTGTSDSLDIRVKLITPASMNARCREPVAIGSRPHTSR